MKWARPLVSFMFLLIENCGCRRNAPKLDSTLQRVATLKQLDDLYYQYVTGDRNTAARALSNGISLLESSSCFANSDRAQLLNLEYSRLAVMEHKLGEKGADDAHLFCAQYWQLKTDEMDNEPLQTEMEKIKRLNIEDAVALVEAMDKKLHGGKLANYNQEPTRQPSHR